MAVSLDRPLVSPVLVGRAPQLDAFERLVERTRSGHGQIVLLAGEAGAGKTRLAAEARAKAIQHGFRVLEGACFETDRAFPYSVVLDLLRDIAFDPFTSSASVNSEEERWRLFRDVTRLLTELAQQQPLLVVLEDLQWSDDNSLELLRYVAPRLTATP
jgi:predicted ATPase